MAEAIQNKRPVSNIILLTIVIEILQPLFAVWNLPHSLMVYLRFFCAVLSLFYVVAVDPKRVFSKPVLFYTLWAAYVFIRNLVLGYAGYQSPVQMFLTFGPSYIVFIVCFYSFYRDEDKALKWIIAALYIFVVFGFFSTRGSVSGGVADDERLGGELINANALGIRASLITFFLAILFIRSKISFPVYIALLIIPIFTILLSGSRTAFAIVFFVALYFVFVSGEKKNVWLLRSFALILGGIAVLFVLKNTSMGERIMDVSSQAEEYGLYTGTIWDVFGDRGYQYFTAIPVIQENYIFGIGMGNYLDTVPGAITVLHSEYLIQLLELGGVAFVLYYSLYISISKGLIITRREVSPYWKSLSTLCLLFMLAMLFTCFVTRVSYYGMYSCGLAYMAYCGYHNK